MNQQEHAQTSKTPTAIEWSWAVWGAVTVTYEWLLWKPGGEPPLAESNWGIVIWKCLIFFGFLALAGWTLIDKIAKHAAETAIKKEIETLDQLFPSRCVTCAQIRAAKRTGVILPTPEHDCPEARSLTNK